MNRDASDTQTLATVRMHMDMAGLPITDQQIADLARGYTALRTSVETLWQLAETQHQAPALTFRA